MKRLNKTTYQIEQSLEAYSCSCSCTVTNNCHCSCPGDDSRARIDASFHSMESNLISNSYQVNSTNWQSQSHAVISPHFIC